MEWRAVIPCKNGATLHIMFEGGSASTNGIIPAKYRTDNEVVQALIESSDLYKRGKIRLVRTITTQETKENTSAKQKKAPVAEKSSPTEKNEKKVVKVTDIEGAGRKYLIDNYGANPRLLNGVNAILAQADAYGIKFTTE